MSEKATVLRQFASTPTTRYEAVRRPSEREGYVQRIPVWEAVKRLAAANRSELLSELRSVGYRRPNGAPLNEAYCRIELTDMTRRGYLRRIED
jgi:hypothetical protein